MKDILFVTPSLCVIDGPEIGLLSVASYIERETKFSLKVIDMNTEKLRGAGKVISRRSSRMSPEELKGVIIKECPRIVAVSGATDYAAKSLRVLKLAKEVNSAITTVIGGHHASATMNKLLGEHPYVDILVYGEGEDTFLEIARNVIKSPKASYSIRGTVVRDGSDIRINPPRELRKDIDFFPFLNRDLVPIRCYPTPYRIISSRGCPFNCVFCLRKVFGKSWRGRSVNNVVDEIEFLHKKYGWKKFTFSDDNFTLSKNRVKEIAHEILRRNLAIEWNTGNGIRADCVDYETLKLMKKAGCTAIGIGIETGSPRILQNIKKNETLEHMMDAIKNARSLGLRIHGSFMVGNPGDNMSTIRRSIEFAEKCIDNGLLSVSWNMVVPYPGTELWNYVLNKGKVLRTDYENDTRFRDRPIFETDDFSAASRTRAIRMARRATWLYLKGKKIKVLLHDPGKIWPFTVCYCRRLLSSKNR